MPPRKQPNQNKAQNVKSAQVARRQKIKTFLDKYGTVRVNRRNITDEIGEVSKKLASASLVPVEKVMSMRSRGPGRNGSRTSTPKTGLSLASAKYVAAMLNPWCLEARDAFIPIGNGRGSMKFMSFNRFDITIGTAGVGWVLVSPTNTSNHIAWHTTAAYTGTTAVPFLTAATQTLNTGVVSINSNAPINATNCSAAYNPGVPASASAFGRVVACGMTCSYTGTTVNQGGLLYCFVDPDHASVVGSSAATLGSRSECEVTNIERSKCYLADFPRMEEESQFDRSTQLQAAPGFTNIVAGYPFSSGVPAGPDSSGGILFPITAIGQPTMVILATGAAGNTLHIEIVQHLEYQGPAAEGRLTDTLVDAVGFGVVTSAVSRASARRQTRGGADFADAFYRSLSEVQNELKPISGSRVRAIIG